MTTEPTVVVQLTMWNTLLTLKHKMITQVSTRGWLRLAGSLKSFVSFAEYCLFYRVLLQKRPMILRSLLIEATRYGVATVSRIDKFKGLFCKRALLKRRYSAKETHNFVDPTDRGHSISNDHRDYSVCAAHNMKHTAEFTIHNDHIGVWYETDCRNYYT